MPTRAAPGKVVGGWDAELDQLTASVLEVLGEHELNAAIDRAAASITTSTVETKAYGVTVPRVSNICEVLRGELRKLLRVH